MGICLGDVTLGGFLLLLYDMYLGLVWKLH